MLHIFLIFLTVHIVSLNYLIKLVNVNSTIRILLDQQQSLINFTYLYLFGKIKKLRILANDELVKINLHFIISPCNLWFLFLLSLLFLLLLLLFIHFLGRRDQMLPFVHIYVIYYGRQLFMIVRAYKITQQR